MKFLLFLTIVFLISSSGFAGNSWSHITCHSVDEKSDFTTVEFMGHATEQETIKVTFKDSTGATTTIWNEPINGFARRGFIKISQEKELTPSSKEITNIMANEPRTFPGKPFSAKYSQFTN
jgi:hypothetical protein